MIILDHRQHWINELGIGRIPINSVFDNNEENKIRMGQLKWPQPT